MVTVTWENHCVDFAMRYDRWYRPLATVFGLGPKWTTIQVVDDTLRVKHGWAFRIDVPLKDIKSARLVRKRPWAWGVHQAKDGWLVNGSRHGIVEVKFASPVKPKKPLSSLPFSGPFRSLYLSLTKPDSFIAALNSHT
jgi:hypothetical protein